MLDGITANNLMLAPGGLLMVKSANYVTSGRVVWGTDDVRMWCSALGLEHVDELGLLSTGMQPTTNLDGSTRRQVHARQNMSNLSIWRKPKSWRQQRFNASEWSNEVLGMKQDASYLLAIATEEVA